MPRILELFRCDTICGYYTIDNWEEVKICKHPKFHDSKYKIKYIKSIKKDGFPSFCPLDKSENI
jgi:hypothetical protein